MTTEQPAVVPIARALATMSHVYFMIDSSKEAIRIGSTSDLSMDNDGIVRSRRLNTHLGSRHKLLAITVADMAFEDKLHDYFDKNKIHDGSNSESHYKAAAVSPYIQRLLAFRLATNDLQKSPMLCPIDPRLLHPKYVLAREKDGFLFFGEPERAAERNCWQTPAAIANIIRKALGGVIDLDPCTTLEANERVKAKWGFTEKTNGLIHPWKADTVYMNPPYGNTNEKLELAFVNKFHAEFKLGNFKRGVMCLNLQTMCSQWFEKRIPHYSSVAAIAKTRIQFHGPLAKSGSPAYGASKNGTVFIWYGADPTNFLDAFAEHAYFVSFDQQQFRRLF